MIRLRDFAAQQGVSERTVQLKLKAAGGLLDEHVDRRGKLGTWLDEFAQDYLRGQLMHQTVQVIDADENVTRLLAELAEAERKYGVAMETVSGLKSELREADKALGKVDMLLLRSKEDKEKIEDLEKNVDELKVAKGVLEQRLEDLESENESKDAALAKERAQIEQMKRASLWQRIRGWKE